LRAYKSLEASERLRGGSERLKRSWITVRREYEGFVRRKREVGVDLNGGEY
jgi:hypothetical protein